MRYLVDRFSPLGVAEVLRESDANGATLRSYTYGTQLLSRTEVTGVSATYLLDGLGSTRGLTDASGALSDSFAYTAMRAPFSTVTNSSKRTASVGILRQGLSSTKCLTWMWAPTTTTTGLTMRSG